MASGLFDTTRNFSLYAVPVAWALSLTPHMYAASQSKIFDNRSPRTYTKEVEQDQSIDKATKTRIARAEAAQQNGFENVGLFASAVVAGNLAGLSSTTLNTLSMGYLASRVVYNLVYINNNTEAMANVRSVIYLVGVGQIMSLYVMAGNVLREKAANIL